MTLAPFFRAELIAHRVSGDIRAGVQLLHSHLRDNYPKDERHHALWQGLFDLRASDAAQEEWLNLPQPNQKDRIGYAKFLWRSGDPIKAYDIIKAVERLGPKAQELHDTICHQRSVLLDHDLRNMAELPAAIFRAARTTIPKRDDGGILMYTGQLGPGGAETQFARLAVSLQKHRPAGGLHVAVRHTDPARKGGFQLGRLKDAGIDPYVISKDDTAPALDWLPSPLQHMVAALPDQTRDAVIKLTAHQHRIGAARSYIWQDGAMIAGALAAALNGAWRIATSFRGLPPNLRPKFMKTEYQPLYETMLADADTEFSTNSAVTAQAYEDWLQTPKATISTIPNAVAKPSVHANKQAQATLQDILSESPECTKTILGVFRTDDVKQPDLWFNTAFEISAHNPKLRFIHIGPGALSDSISKRLSAQNRSKHVFRVGLSDAIGFWMSQSDMLMHLALHEGSPNVVIEAQLCGLPVIATPAGGTIEEISDDETGILLPSTSPTQTEIKSAFDRLLLNPDRSNKIATQAERFARQRHDPDEIRRQTMALLRVLPA